MAGAVEPPRFPKHGAAVYHRHPKLETALLRDAAAGITVSSDRGWPSGLKLAGALPSASVWLEHLA